MKLNKRAKHAHKLWSVRLSLLAAALGAAELVLPLWRDIVPDGVFAGAASIIGISAALARVIKQEGISDE